MSFIPAKCPSCGGDLQVPNDRDSVKCMYCGGTVIVREAAAAASGVQVHNLMALAKSAAEAGNAREAYDYYTRVLEIDPSNSLAWEGKGTSAGWLSTLSNIRTNEMMACFDNAIKQVDESKQEELKRRCGHAVNRVTTAVYSTAQKQLNEFIQVDTTWPDYVANCALLIETLEKAHQLDPSNPTTVENIITICLSNINGYKFLGFYGETRTAYLADVYKTGLQRKVHAYTATMQELDPSYARPVEKKSSSCFVATVTLGAHNHPYLRTLREFRNDCLGRTKTGRAFIRWYYDNGPAVARVVHRHRLLRLVILGLVVLPTVGVARLSLWCLPNGHLTSASKLNGDR